MERLGHAWSAVSDLDCVALRYFNVFGPRQSLEYAAVIPSLASRMVQGLHPILTGDGRQTRDFCFVADVVAANLAAISAPVAGSAIEIARGESTSLLQLVDLLNELLGTQLVPQFSAPRPGDLDHSVADLRQARELLGYVARTSLKTGLAQTLDWVKSW